MGSGISSAITTHAELYKRTAGTRRMVDDIFTYMMHHLKVNDFMKLSNPDSCKKYVLFMANNLSMFFSKLSVVPKLGKDGVLAFRSIEDLQELKGPAKQEKESLCLVLAYFYTRIFQIYGALALTLLDDINYTVENTALMSARPATEARTDLAPTPGQPYTFVEPRAPKQLRTDPFRGGQMGGWISKLGYFDFMNQGILVDKEPVQQPFANPYVNPYANPYGTPYATTAPMNQYGYTVNYVYKDQTQKYMYFKPAPADAGGRDVASTDSQKGTFSWVDSSKKIFELVVSARKGVDNNHAQFSVDSIRYRKVRDTVDTTINKAEIKDILSLNKQPQDVVPDSIIISSTSPFPVISQTQPAQATYSIEGVAGYTDIKEYFKALFNTVVKYVTDQYDSGDSIAGRSGYDAINIRRFYENYTNVKPLGHCIARALQLLNADPYGRDAQGKQFVSSMCQTSFFVPQGKTEAERKGVPKPDEPITESPGIMSTVLLFYDTIGHATPHLFMSKPAFEQYKVFMKRMAGLFMGKEAAKLSINNMDIRDIHPKTAQAEKEKIKFADGKMEIKDLRTKEIGKVACPDGKPVPLDSDTKKNVHNVVYDLFKRQWEHAGRCEKVLQKLFTLERQENMPVRIKINDALLKGGLAALNQINAEVRQILIEYYSDCEAKYIVGVKHIEHQGHKKQEEDKKQQALKVQQELLVKQTAEKAKLDAAPQQPPVIPPPQLLKPQGPPVAGPIVAGPAVRPPFGPVTAPVVRPPLGDILPKAPPIAPQVLPAPLTPLTPEEEQEYIKLQKEQDAKPESEKRLVSRRLIDLMGRKGMITAEKQAAQIGQQMTNTSTYRADIVPILQDKFKGTKLASNTVSAISSQLVERAQRIPVEQLRGMTKEQITATVLNTGRPRRSKGGTRKHITSLRNMTRRLGRQ